MAIKKHFFVETEVGNIHEISEYRSTTGQAFDLDDIEDFDNWANEVIHLSKIVDNLPDSLQGFFIGEGTEDAVLPFVCSLKGSRRAWMEEW